MSEQNGVVPKCPSCGGALKAFAARCELCGHELTGVGANRTVVELVNKFNEIEATLVAAGLQGSKLEKEVSARRARVIRDLPIPNAREDLLSLIHFILPKLQGVGKRDPNEEDWRVKFTEVMNLARNAYRGDVKTREELEALERSANLGFAETVKERTRRNPMLFLLVGGVAVLAVVGLISTQWQSWQEARCTAAYTPAAQAETARLESIVAIFDGKLQQKDYAAAQAELAQLRWQYQEDCKAEAVAQETAAWETRRQALAARIEAAQAAEREQAAAEIAREKAAQQAELDQEKAREAEQQRAVAAQAEARRIARAEAELAQRARRGAETRQARD